jgi:hypothetical protein
VSLEWAVVDAAIDRAEAEALAAGAQVVLDDALERVPKRSGHLASEGRLAPERGGDHTIGIVFGGPYARWVHEHLQFKHPYGGEAKFLETATVVKADDAIDETARVLRGAL